MQIFFYPWGGFEYFIRFSGWLVSINNIKNQYKYNEIFTISEFYYNFLRMYL
jgi:hypothetical protein